MLRASDVLLNMFLISPKKYCVLSKILRFKVFGLVTSFALRINSTVLVLWQMIYGGRLLLFIALVIATC